MLEREDGELQRELSHLLSALIQLQPLLRNLQLEVGRSNFRLSYALTHWSRGIQKGVRTLEGSIARAVQEEAMPGSACLVM